MAARDHRNQQRVTIVIATLARKNTGAKLYA
jgi:hypothetical protein